MEETYLKHIINNSFKKDVIFLPKKTDNLRIAYTPPKDWFRFPYVAISLLGIFIISILSDEDVDPFFYITIFFIVLVIELIFPMLDYFLRTKKGTYFIFDRLRGNLMFPAGVIKKEITVLTFKNIKIREGAYLMVFYGDDKLELLQESFLEYFGDNHITTWSFLVWYMDKNRPLPPGPVLDPYRDADFERRKAEGFPPPLYPSQVPTPEATSAQQEEREKYWKG